METIFKKFLINNKIPSFSTPGRVNKNNNLEQSFKDFLTFNKYNFISQPNGNQNFPDFQIFVERIKFNIECKSSKKGVPMWNCGFPVLCEKTWYIFHRTEDDSWCFLKGSELVTTETFILMTLIKNKNNLNSVSLEAYENKYSDYIQECKILIENLNRIQNQINIKLQDSGFSFYIRNMFNQKSRLNYYSKDYYIKKFMIQETDLNELSLVWKYKTSKQYRNKMGQFFTGRKIKKYILNRLENLQREFFNILEPAVGSGELLDLISCRYSNASVTGFEIDPDLFSRVQKNYPRFTIYNQDYLDSSGDYDLIISNPPYNELNKLPAQIEKYRKNFTCIGKSNIYFLFVEKCLSQLKKNGVAIFIIPSSFASSPGCEQIRNKIIEKKILDVKLFGKFDSEVSQEVIILTLENTECSLKNYTTQVKDSCYISFNKELTVYNKTISDLDLNISVGSIVWNQHKNNLTSDSSNFRLVYSKNINNFKFAEFLHSEKKPFINCDCKYLVHGIKILMKRSHKKGEFDMIKTAKKVCVENHVLVITGIKINLVKFYENMKNKKVIDFIKSISGTCHISISTLKNIPLIE